MVGEGGHEPEPKQTGGHRHHTVPGFGCEHCIIRTQQVKKAEIRTLLQNIDKETAATITFEEFLEMATPKVQNRDEKEEIMKVRATHRKIPAMSR